MLEAIKALLRERGVSFPEDKELAIYEDSDVEYGGYCETCSYEEAVFYIGVSWDNGKEKATVKYYGTYSFGDLIGDLDRLSR